MIDLNVCVGGLREGAENKSMWATWVVAAVALAAVAFMLRFLTALLHESARTVCFWTVPVRRETEEEEHLGVLAAGVNFDDHGRAMESDHGDYRWELLENEHHAKAKCTAVLVAFGVHPVSDLLDPRPIHPKRGYVFREPRL